jgi:hypothetical protein
MQFEEMPSGVCHTADFGHPFQETGFVAADMWCTTYQRLCCGGKYVLLRHR